MIEITRWLDRQARRDRRRPCLEAALLSRSLWPYILYRLQYFALRLAARLAVHVVSFAFMYRVFSRPALVAAVAAHAVAASSTSFWWGALETMRARVRALHRNSQSRRIAGEVARWLPLSLRAAAGVLLVAAAWQLWIATGGGRFGAAQLYQAVIAVRLAVQIVTLTLHSGVFAIRRIYRPPWTIAAVELAGFGAALAFWPIAGAWSLPLASLAGGLASSTIVVAYTLRAYRLIGIAPRSLVVSSLRGPLPTRVPWREFMMAGVANAAIKLDTLLVLSAVGLGTFVTRWAELAPLLFLLSPLVRAAQDWAQLFYFDLKRLEPALLAGARARYDRLVSATAWWLGLFLWAAGGLLIVSVFRAPPPVAYLFLLPIFPIRAVLSIAQLRAFVAGRYVAALASAAVWIAAAVVLLMDGNAELKQVLAFGGPLFAWALPSRLRDGTPRAADDTTVRTVVQWLAEVGAAHDRVRIRAVQLDVRGGYGRDSRAAVTASWWATTRIARRIARRLGRRGAATAIWPNRVVWHERGETGRISREWLVRAAAGRLSDVLDTGVAHTGSAALAHVRDAGLFGATIDRAPSDCSPDAAAEALERRFSALCPGGVVYSKLEPPPVALSALSNAEKRRILSDAIAFSRDFRPGHPRAAYDVTALAVDGAVRTIFVQDARADRRRRARWRSLVRDANVAQYCVTITAR